MIDRRLLLPFALLGLVGCSLTPDFPLPEPPIPKAWSTVNSATTMESQSEELLLSWFNFYPHPELQKVISNALASSRELRAATARMAKAAALLGIEATSRLPMVQLDATHQAYRTPGGLSGRQQATITHKQDLIFSLPAFELDFWGRLNSLEEAAKSTFLASEESARAVHIVLIAQVVETFFTWREMSERVAIGETALQTQQAIRGLAQQRMAAGLITAQAELLAIMAEEKSRAELAELQRQESLAANALQLLTGNSVSVETLWPELQEYDLESNFNLDLPARVLVSRPDVRRAEHHLMAANANVGAARAAFWPRILLTTSAGTASQELSGLFGSGSAAWSFLPKIDLPIFDFSRRQNELAAVKAERTALLAEYEQVLQQAFREVADGLSSRGVLLARLAALTTTRDAQQQRLHLIQSRFNAGVDGKEVLLTVQQELYATEQQLRSVKRQVLVNHVALYKALGGGVD